jgi:hypothetical protein
MIKDNRNKNIKRCFNTWETLINPLIIVDRQEEIYTESKAFDFSS